MNLQPTYNEFGSPEKFYRFQTKKSGTTFDSRFGFLAGDSHGADLFQSLDNDKQRSIVQNHSNWSIAKASPFISTTSDLAWAINVANRIRRSDPIYIAEISPGRAVSGSIRYYHWFELVRELSAKIEHKAKNFHETVFLGQIPQEAITWYGTVEEAEGHNFEDEGDEDFEQEQEGEYDEDEDDEDEDEKGDGPLFYQSLYHFANIIFLVNSELLSLMSQLKMDSERDDEEEDEEETEEVEEWYNPDDQLKIERTRADEQPEDGEEETEEVKNMTRVYNEMIADFVDGIGERYFQGEDSDSEEDDSDYRSEYTPF